jgi:hypothetical protein
VAQGLEKKTATEHTSTFLSELVASQLWVLATLITKLSVEQLQVLHPQPQVLHLLVDQDLILAKSFSKALQQVQTLLIYKAN